MLQLDYLWCRTQILIPDFRFGGTVSLGEIFTIIACLFKLDKEFSRAA